MLLLLLSCCVERARAKLFVVCMAQDICVRLQDPSEFVGIFALVPMDPRRTYVAQTFVRMGFQFVPPEAALPPGVPRAMPERPEVGLFAPYPFVVVALINPHPRCRVTTPRC
jgi:hypothetical protein